MKHRIRKFDAYKSIKFKISLISPILITIAIIVYNIFYQKVSSKIFNISVFIIFLYLSIILFMIFYKDRKYLNKFIKVYEDVKRIDELAKFLVTEGVFDKHKSSGRLNVMYRPRIIYKRKNNIVTLKFSSSMVKYQKIFLDITKTITIAWSCDYISRRLEKNYITYEFLLNSLKYRINIRDMTIKKHSLELMYGVEWDFAKFPHGLVCGNTGSGKTYVLMSLIYNLYKLGANCYILDPKKTDLSYLRYKPNFANSVFCDKKDIIEVVDAFYRKMLEREKEFDLLCNGKAGFNYYDFDLKPNFLFFDEFAAFMLECDSKEQRLVSSPITQVILKGRQLGFFIVFGVQRPDVQYFENGTRDQLGLRIGMGIMSKHGYDMLFGDADREYFEKDVVGYGYYLIGSVLIKEFYAPFINKNFDFIEEMDKLSMEHKNEDILNCYDDEIEDYEKGSSNFDKFKSDENVDLW